MLYTIYFRELYPLLYGSRGKGRSDKRKKGYHEIHRTCLCHRVESLSAETREARENEEEREAEDQDEEKKAVKGEPSERRIYIYIYIYLYKHSWSERRGFSLVLVKTKRRARRAWEGGGGQRAAPTVIILPWRDRCHDLTRKYERTMVPVRGKRDDGAGIGCLVFRACQVSWLKR